MDLTPEEQAQERADHEAGHFVILYALPIVHKLKYLILAEAGDSGGCCAFSPPEDFDPKEQAIQVLGGLAASLERLKRQQYELGDPRLASAYRRALQGANLDMEDVRDRLHIDGELFSQCSNTANAVIGANWDLVEAVSAELQARRVLYHEEALMIVEAIRKRDEFTSDLLKVYRDLRRETTSGNDFKDFKVRYPNVPWFEDLDGFVKAGRWRSNEEAKRVVALARTVARREESLSLLARPRLQHG